MRCLVENGTYGLWNLGDVVMLQVAVRRLRERWDSCEVDVVTREAGRLAEFVPEARGLAPGDWNAMYQRQALLRRAKRVVRSMGHSLARSVAGGAGMADGGVGHWVRRTRVGTRSTWRFIERLHAADAVIASGGGYVTDDFVADAMRVLRTLEMAQRMGKKTAMFGQGLGPARNKALLHLARQVLPGLEVIGVRGEGSAAFAREMGVSPERIVVTGDDALDAAHGTKGEAEDRAEIGLNLRTTWYSGMDEERARNICAGVAAAMRRLVGEKGGVRPVAVGVHPREDDAGRVCSWLGLPAAARERAAREATPAGAMGAAGEVRVMVTGSYHAAVFALAQGVPAVGVVASEYYAQKFGGLVGAFGDGMRVVLADDLRSLEGAIGELWASDGTLREALRRAARKQIEAGQAAYRDFLG